MQERHNFKTREDSATSDVISLADILAPLWHSRWLIFFVTMTVAVCALAGAMHFAYYKSEGFFQFGGTIPAVKDTAKEKEHGLGILLSDYKRYAAAYTTSERFFDFVRDRKLESAAGVDDLAKVFSSRDGIAKLVEPVYPFTKLDAKELMEQPKDSSNNVIGLHINYASNTPENAQQIVGLLGRYAMDSIIYQIYSDELRFKHSEIVAKITKLDNDIINFNVMLEKYRHKGADLKLIVSRYPDSSKQAASRQVISVTEDNAHYLPPVTLLATTEVQESEAHEFIRTTKRELQQSKIWLEYYDHAKAALDATRSGETLLRGLELTKESMFKGKNLEDDVIREVYNTITIENQNATNLYLEKSRFIAGPTLPIRSSLRPLFVLAISMVLGLFLSVLLVFARVWWRNNWQKVSG